MENDAASNAAQPKSRRCWYQFTLRTLLVGIALLSLPLGWFGWQVRVVRQRESLMDDLQYHVCSAQDNRAKIPFYRRWLGDKQYGLLGLDDDAPDEALQLYRSSFPEAVVVRKRDLGDGEAEFHRRYGIDFPFDFWRPMIAR